MSGSSSRSGSDEAQVARAGARVGEAAAGRGRYRDGEIVPRRQYGDGAGGEKATAGCLKAVSPCPSKAARQRSTASSWTSAKEAVRRGGRTQQVQHIVGAGMHGGRRRSAATATRPASPRARTPYSSDHARAGFMLCQGMKRQHEWIALFATAWACPKLSSHV